MQYTILSAAQAQALSDKWTQCKLEQAESLIDVEDADRVLNVFLVYNILAEAEKKSVKLKSKDIQAKAKNGHDALSEMLKSLQDRTHGFKNRQKKQIANAAAKRQLSSKIESLFPEGQDRIYIKPQETVVSGIQREIEAFLDKGGYTVTDYEKGYATDEKGKQTFKIGKLLKENKKLFDAFSGDTTRTMGNMMIVISKNPWDIARMSTNRAWFSCMAADRENFRYVPQDVEQGTLIAYMVSENDPNIHYPFSRVLIKPFRTFTKDEKRISNWEYNVTFADYSYLKDVFCSFARRGFQAKNAIGQVISPVQHTTVYVPETKTYGLESQVFHDIVSDFAENQLNVGIAGDFMLDKRLYKDNNREESRFLKRVLAP